MAFVWKVERVHSVGYTVWSVRESEPGCVQSEREVVSVQWCVCELVCAVCTVAAEPGGRVCAAERRRAVLGAPPTPPLTSPPFPSQPLPLSSPSPAPPSPPSSVCGSGRARRHRGRPSAEGGRRAEGGLGWRPGRKHAGPGGAAAAMCRMSFKKETPLANAAFWAARRGNLTLLRLLLNSGRVDVDCRDSHGTTLLMVASYAGHIDCVKELVLQGADINLQRESGTTALFFAAQQGHNDVVRFLFEFGASTEFRTKDGGTALLAASQYGHMQVVETLLKHGANIHDQLYDGTAPLWIASQMGHSEVVRVMLLRGADRDAARNDGTTALLKAANKGYNNVIEELLKFSPTLGILKNGTSALHAAVLSGNIKTVALLLEAGADPALRNKANELPAELTKNERILRLLRSKEGHRKS
ncbi:ankyrin repeat domain-containing protein 29 isoform X3 [Sus scrofa]|uniref:ankyrin repeat domain-containing protein 29 isoform X3 n=1 Tax=Sus scrofa TaxID=9823 RepID=UPI000A2B4260|nr:ankyrin repeat domain-containing protein 29 isoform X3 [Sus scrofa]